MRIDLSFLDAYDERSDVTVTHAEDASHVTVRAPAGSTVALVIPNCVFEWFVTVHDDRGEELLQDWAEHYAISDETEAQLEIEMRDEIEALLHCLTKAPVRLVRGSAKPRVVLQCEMEGAWRQFLPFPLPRVAYDSTVATMRRPERGST